MTDLYVAGYRRAIADLRILALKADSRTDHGRLLCLTDAADRLGVMTPRRAPAIDLFPTPIRAAE